jgi:hypothetical protein
MKNMKKEFKTKKQALQFCNRNGIKYSDIISKNKTILITRQFDGIVYRQYPREITVYTVTL